MLVVWINSFEHSKFGMPSSIIHFEQLLLIKLVSCQLDDFDIRWHSTKSDPVR